MWTWRLREVEMHPSLHSWLVRQDLNPGLSTLGSMRTLSTIPGLREAHCSSHPPFLTARCCLDQQDFWPLLPTCCVSAFPLPSYQIWGWGFPSPQGQTWLTSPHPRSPPLWFPRTHSFPPRSFASSVPLCSNSLWPYPRLQSLLHLPLATPQMQVLKRSHFRC